VFKGKALEPAVRRILQMRNNNGKLPAEAVGCSGWSRGEPYGSKETTRLASYYR